MPAMLAVLSIIMGPEMLAAGAEEAGAETAVAEGSTTLYRAVQPGELSNILETGTYQVPKGMGEVKAFFQTAEEASNFSKAAYSSGLGQGGPFTITSGVFPTAGLPAGIPVAGEGTALFLPASAFPAGPVTVLPYAPIP